MLREFEHGSLMFSAHTMALNGLSPAQYLAIRYLAAGWSIQRVSQELKLRGSLIKSWHLLEEFNKELESATVAHSDAVETMLLAGERKAAKTLIDALGAETRGGPNWNVRVNAALSLLDRAGGRGKAVEKQQIAQVVAHTDVQPDAEKALRNALRDPGVREWLKSTGKMPELAAGAVQPEGPQAIEAEFTIADETLGADSFIQEKVS